MSIRQKLLALLGAVVVGFSALLTLASVQIHHVQVGGPVYGNLETHTRMARNLALLRADLSEARALSTSALYTKDTDQLRAWHRKLEELSGHVGLEFGELLQGASDEPVRELLESARATWEEFAADNNSMLLGLIEKRPGLSRHFLDKQSLRQERFTEQVESLIGMLALQNEDLEERARASARRSVWLVMVGGAALAIGVVYLTIALARSIGGSLGLLVEACRGVAGGDFSTRADVAREDEVGILASAFNSMCHEVGRKTEDLERARQEAVGLHHELAGRVSELEEALGRVKQLQGLLPLCAWCKKVRREQSYWQAVEDYVAEHSEVQFSHGICPDCKGKVLLRRESHG